MIDVKKLYDKRFTMFNKKIILAFFTIGILALAAFFRLYGVNWDQGQHLHPDERFLTMVATGIAWPKSISEYFDTVNSPLNPHNRGFGFFVYGTFPVFFTKWVAESLGKGDYGNLTLVGRQLSALFDLGTVVLVYLIAKQLSNKHQIQSTKSQTNLKFKAPNPKQAGMFKYLKFGILNLFGNWKLEIRIFPLLAMFFYAASVLPIQLSHFYAVETYLTFFITLSFYLLIRIITSTQTGNKLTTYNLQLTTLLGISFGLAIASKITAVLFLPIIGLGFLYFLLKRKNLFLFFVLGFLFLVFSYFTVRLAQPYLFADSSLLTFSLNPKILQNWKELSNYMKPSSGFPPSIQWFNTQPILFPFKNMLLWGLGVPLGIIALSAIGYRLWVVGYMLIRRKINQQLTTHNLQLNLILLWILLLFIYQGIQPAPTIRYFIPIYPFLAILSGLFMAKLFKKSKIFSLLLLVIILTWPLSFISIYSRLHSRVAASEWIYNNIPKGATIATEHWDDGLPLSLDQNRINQYYNFVELTPYFPDSAEKWQKMAETLSKADYISLSSNRIWASLTRVPDKFPLSARYYKLLFAGQLGFEKVAEVTSYPDLPIPFLNNKCLYIMPPQENKLGLISDKGGLININGCGIYQNITYHGLVIRDESAEETFTVYDHPKVIIFKKTPAYNNARLLTLLGLE